MNSKFLFEVLVIAAAFLNCNSTVGEGTKAPNPPPPHPTQGSGLETQLGGQYVKKLQLRKGEEAILGPQQPLSLQFQASGLSSVRQFEVVVSVEPAEAFDLSASSFSPDKPFITVGAGVEITAEKNLRLMGVFLDAAGYSGDGGLGTLHLKTSSSFSIATQAKVRVLRFSIGPSSTERDNYTEQDLNLGLSFGP